MGKVKCRVDRFAVTLHDRFSERTRRFCSPIDIKEFVNLGAEGVPNLFSPLDGGE
jgi:hypothetical protein